MVLIMDKKTIQEERIKRYFINAASEILRGEGLKCVNVRNIADRAGYSYATLYNYFKDVRDLIFECVKDFRDECIQTVKSETDSLPHGLEKIEGIAKAYIKYYIQYPGVFELFFLEKTSDLAGKQPTIEMIYRLLDDLCNEEWQHCVDNKLFSNDEAELKRGELKFVVHGLLLFYLNRKQPSSFKEFFALSNIQLKNVLKV